MPNPYMPQGYGRGGYQAPNTNMGGPGNPRGVYNSPQQSAAYYGPSMPQSFSGQQPGLNRYQPPMMYGSNPNDWTQGGGYSYNLPNSYGHAYNGGYGGIVPQYAYGGGPWQGAAGGMDPGAAAYGQQGRARMNGSGQGQYMQYMPQWGPQANDVYIQQPRGTGRGGGGGGQYMQMMQQLMQMMQGYYQGGGQEYDPNRRQSYGGDARIPPAGPQGYAKPAAAPSPAVPQQVSGNGYDWSTSPLGWPRP